MKQARFWEGNGQGGLVRVKIAEGQTLHHIAGGTDTEGYWREVRAYSFDGKTVTVQSRIDSSDCDGRHSRSGIARCDVAQLAAGYFETETGVAFPAWQTSDGPQRDYFAEAAGY